MKNKANKQPDGATPFERFMLEYIDKVWHKRKKNKT